MSACLTPETTPVVPRRLLRKELIARRLALSPEECERLSSVIRGHVRGNFPQLSGMRVSFYWPIKNEPDLRPLMKSWTESANAGFMALLPLVVGNDAALAFRTWRLDSTLIPDDYGIPVPAEGEFLEPEAVLLPVNAFDAAGYRIGYGGGFFDRTLATLRPKPLTIGIGFELSRIDSIVPESHDVRLDAIVTEAGVFRHD